MTRKLIPYLLTIVFLVYSSVYPQINPSEDITSRENLTIRQTEQKERPPQENKREIEDPVSKIPQSSTNDSYKYLVGPGDVLTIEVWRHPETSKEVIVNYRGEITLPPIKKLLVAGMSTPEIEEKLAESLSFYLIDPIVYVTVKEYNSQKISVFGEAVPNRGKGEFPLRKPTPLLEFLSQIGGPTENADTSKITLIKRNGDTFIYDLEELLNTPLKSNQIILEGGDTIYIPTVKHSKIYVLGEVNRPQSVDYEKEMSIIDAISLAEGLTTNAVARSIIVVRGEMGSQEGLRVDFRKLRKEADLSQNIPLLPGDIVFVPRTFIVDVERFLRILSTPLLFWFTTTSIK